MLEIFGDDNSEEWRVAKRIADLLKQQWPDISNSKDDNIKIFANAKIYGGRTQDIDVLLIGQFKEGRWITPTRKLRDQANKQIILRRLFIQNILLTIEVKSHDSTGVLIEGLTAKVRYGDKWHSATKQNEDQKYALLKYLKNSNISLPWVTGLIVFTNLAQSYLPPRPHNILPGEFSLKEFFTVIAELNEKSRTKPGEKNGNLSASPSESFRPALDLPIFQKSHPTSLDRRKMDRITTRSGINGNLSEALGKKPIILRGRGGTGKTVILLQLAYRAYCDFSSRTLFLTYNLALVADVRRSMNLLGIPSNYEAGGIRVESSVSFFCRILHKAGLIPDDINLMESYEDSLQSLSEIISADNISSEEIQSFLESDKELFGFDYVMIDEAQDWPKSEAKSLVKLYPPASFVIADGQDQLIRGSYTNWKDAFETNECHVQSFNQSLRMKSNLARFINEFSNHLGVPNWKVKPNNEAQGGRIIVIEKKYVDCNDLHSEILSEKALGENKPIDTLFCVPPSQVTQIHNSERESLIATWLRKQGYSVWDGASTDVRRDIPHSENQYRVVQYQSCRGLEGWIVVCLDLDQHYNNKLEEASSNNHLSNSEDLGYNSEANIFAAFWTLMPLCRAMDTLVLSISTPDGPVGRALKACQNKYPDYIEWRR